MSKQIATQSNSDFSLENNVENPTTAFEVCSSDPKSIASNKMNVASASTTVSIESVFKEFEIWRASKNNPASPIPDALWRKVFQLAEIYSPNKIRAIFNLNSKQYQKKYTEFFPTLTSSAIPLDSGSNIASGLTPNQNNQFNSTVNQTHNVQPPSLNDSLNPSDFAQVKIKKSSYQPQDLPSAKTLVVEFYRADGQRMSIHTTQDSIPTLLNTFFNFKITG